MYEAIKDISYNSLAEKINNFGKIDKQILTDYDYNKQKMYESRIATETNKIQLINQNIKNIEKKLSTANALKVYIDRVAKNKRANSDEINFEHGFYFFRTLQGKSREANYRTAVKLYNELTQFDTAFERVLNPENIQETRQQEVDIIQKSYTGFFSKKIIRGSLKAIVNEAEKLRT